MENNFSAVRKHITVTCAIIERDGFVLATQRSASMSMPGKWEFPGGKIDPGESPEECLHREIHEEIAIKIRIASSLPACTHKYPTFTITLLPFICTIENGELILHEHADMVWLMPSQLPTLDWAEADIPVMEAYISQRSRKV